MKTKAPGSFAALTLIAFAFVALLCLQMTSSAQTDQGRIVGTVTDANGAVVPGASVVIKNERTGEERTATTNDAGYYFVLALRPSSYSITATAQNLTVRLTNVQLMVGQELKLGLTLQATGVEAKVDISAAGESALDTGSAAMGVNVNPREVEAL